MDWLYCWYVGMGYGLLSLLADWDGVWDMGYGLPVLLVYRDGIWDRGYGLQVYRDGYGL